MKGPRMCRHSNVQAYAAPDIETRPTRVRNVSN